MLDRSAGCQKSVYVDIPCVNRFSQLAAEDKSVDNQYFLEGKGVGESVVTEGKSTSELW